jgi:hypothetical protein
LIGTVKDHLGITRVVSIFLNLYTSVNNTKLRRGGNKKHGSFVSRAFMVWVDKVDEGWYPSKMNDLIIFVKIT